MRPAWGRFSKTGGLRPRCLLSALSWEPYAESTKNLGGFNASNSCPMAILAQSFGNLSGFLRFACNKLRPIACRALHIPAVGINEKKRGTFSKKLNELLKCWRVGVVRFNGFGRNQNRKAIIGSPLIFRVFPLGINIIRITGYIVLISRDDIPNSVVWRVH